MEFVDRNLTCMDCGQLFVFTGGEQEFYDRKGFKEEPKRCKTCRDVRKSRRTGDFMTGAAGGGGAGGGGGGAAGGGNGATRVRPKSNGNGNGNGGVGEDDSIGNRASTRGPREVREVGDLRGHGPREMFDATCAQCGVETRVPFKPVAGRPVYCRECYGHKRGVNL